MKSFSSFATYTGLVMTFFVTCPIYGQPANPTNQQQPAPSEALGPNDARHSQLPVLIDFSKINFQNPGRNKINKELRMGPGSGGGGNSCSLMLKQSSSVLIQKINDYDAFEVETKNLILKAIRSTKFLLGSDLVLAGKKVDAINYPDEKIVVVEEKFCTRTENLSAGSMGLLLHEYLGIAGIDDTQYQISGEFIKSYFGTAKTVAFEDSDSNNILFNRLRERFSKAKPPNVSELQLGKTWYCYNVPISGEPSNIQWLVLNKFDGLIMQKNAIGKKAEKDEMLPVAFVMTDSGLVSTMVPQKYKGMIFTYNTLRIDTEGHLLAEWSAKPLTNAAQDSMKQASYPRGLGFSNTYAATYSVCSKKAP